MLNLLGSFWWRNKERFIILLTGVFIVSSGLSLLSGLTESNKGTVMETLQNKWQVSYHILVRPQGTILTDEQNSLMEPNLPGGISGGITVEQLQKIKELPEVDVAAPLAVVGYSGFGFAFNEQAKLKEYGVYRFKLRTTSNNGVQSQTTDNFNFYITYGPWQTQEAYSDYGINYSQTVDTIEQGLEYSGLLVGVDPVEEQKLVGLSQAVLPLPNGENRYFNTKDITRVEQMDHKYKLVDLPILVSSNVLPADNIYSFQYDRLDIPFATAEQAIASMEKVKANGAEQYLDKVSVGSSQTYNYTSEQVLPDLIESISNKSMPVQGIREFLRSTPLTFKPVTSPYTNRWPNAYQLQTFDSADDSRVGSYPEFYRVMEKLSDPDNSDEVGEFFLRPKYIGMYDPAKLQVAKDADNIFPMDTYSTPAAKYVLDKEGHPVNPQVAISSIHNPLGFMTSPPTMLTTLDAAIHIMGNKAISVIRVKVDGVSEVTEMNRQKLERVAETIREQTGLLADVTFASSPQSVLIQIPPSGTQTALGWIEQKWIKLGATFTLVNEVKVGFSGMLILVMLVAVVYVVATNLVSFLVRKKQFAILLSTGWRYSQINKLILTEAGLIGLFVALVIWSIETYFIFSGEQQISLNQFLFMGFCGFLIYMIGAIAPMIMVKRISPMEALRAGETTAEVRRITPVSNLFQLALAHFNGKMKRNLLSILSMTIPATLMMFFLFVTFRLQGTFYTSWLGQYAAAEIGPMHYLAVCICLMISILTVCEIMWQNVSERSEEISLLKAIGWRKGSIRRLILWEGAIAGILSGMLSLILGSMFITLLYREYPGSELWVVVPVSFIPLLAGLAGSIVPAELAVAMGLKRGLAGKTSVSARKGNLLKIVLATMLILMLIVSVASIRRIMIQDKVSTHITAVPALVDSNTIIPVAGSDNIDDFSEYTLDSIQNGNKAAYKLNLQMDEQGQFTVKAEIKVTNTSSDQWDQLIFYMIPNVFTQKDRRDQAEVYREDARFDLKKVLINGQSVSYTLNWDTLAIPLVQGLAPLAQTEVVVMYTFTLPKNGIRFSRTAQSYDLAQWYPMLATYTIGWNKEPYTLAIESFYTDFSDFTLQFKLPESYRVISSADNDPSEEVFNGQLRASNIKEMMVSFTKELTPIRRTVDNVEINLWSVEEDKKQMESYLDIAAEALHYFIQKIGPYPHKQLDVILGDRLSMEYPGIVTVYSKGEDTKHSLVHEIAHQWFYGVVSNDPYNDGWLDEGMTELATSLFLNDFSFSEKLYNSARQFSNLPLSEYRAGQIASSIYAQPVMKFRGLFESRGEDGWGFLRVYFKKFQYKQVDTKSFVQFVKKYYKMSDDSFFDEGFI